MRSSALSEAKRAAFRRLRRRRISRYFRLAPRFWKAVGLGLLSLGLYLALFLNEQSVLAWSVSHSWSFLVPVAIAFVFSFVHGAFTGAFWDAVGFKPKSVGKK